MEAMDDMWWNKLIDEHLQLISCHEDREGYTFEKYLENLFGEESKNELQDILNREICEKCMIAVLNTFILNQHLAFATRKNQLHFLLNTAKHVTKNEYCFRNLCAKNAINDLFHIIELNIASMTKDTNLLILDLLNSFLKHPCGINELLSNSFWIFAHNLITEYQNLDKEVSDLGYDFLITLLQKTNSIDPEISCGIIKIIVEPIVLNKAGHFGKSSKDNEEQGGCNKLLCLVEIVERLLKCENYNGGVLNCFITLKIKEACEKLASNTEDKGARLILNRVVIILSLFQFVEIPRKSKIVTEDPLKTIEFLKIVESEIDKGALDLVIDFYYHTLKYVKQVWEKLPTFVVRDHTDLENQLISFQVEPILLISEKLKRHNAMARMVRNDILRETHWAIVLKNLSFQTLKIGMKIREVLPTYDYPLFINAVRNISQSRYLYSKEHLGNILEALIYSLQDTIGHVDNDPHKHHNEWEYFQDYIFELMKAIMTFIESFNLRWADGAKVLELNQILSSGCNNCKASQWQPRNIVQGIRLLKEIISRKLSPSLSLLLDCGEEFKDIGPLLYRQCFSEDWEVRKEVMDALRTIAVSANENFVGFKSILTNSDLHTVVSNMALADKSMEVRAAAFGCLYQMFKMEDMEELLPKNMFIERVLDMLMSDTADTIKSEAIKLVSLSYLKNELEENVLSKVYECLRHIALFSSDDRVQAESFMFWCNVMYKHFLAQGWTDKGFPEFTFNKRIVPMTTKEIHKRVYTALTQLSSIGCLHVFYKNATDAHLPKESSKYLKSKIISLNSIFTNYEVSPKSMLGMDDGSLDIPMLSPVSSQYSSNSEDQEKSDDILQQLINDTIGDLFLENGHLIQSEEFCELNDLINSPIASIDISTSESLEKEHQITPAAFVSLIHKKAADLINNDEASQEFPLECRTAILKDVYDTVI